MMQTLKCTFVRPTARLILLAATLLVVPSLSLAQDLTKRAKPQEMPIAITNAVIHPVSGPPIARGYVLFDKGLITEVGPMDDGRVFIATVRQIDATGKHVYPGMISPYTQLGLAEIAAVRASRDSNEAGDISPEAVAASAVNPDSTLLPVTRSNGVLCAGVFPAGGSIPGRASVIQLEGWTPEQLTIKRDAGLVVSWPLMRTITALWMDKSAEEQERDIRSRTRAIRDAFTTARSYLAARKADPASLPVDLRWEAFAGTFGPDAKTRTPVFIEANEYDQITAALAFAQEFGLRIVIIGGNDAPLAAAELKRLDIPVICNSTHRVPRRDDSAYDEAYTLPARLAKAGIRFALASGEETPHERNLPYVAAMAVAHGLDESLAIRSITLSAAEILGVDAFIGSLAPGKHATLIITDGPAMEITTNTTAAFIQGMEIDLRNKQSALAEKYIEKYKDPRFAKPGNDAKSTPGDAKAPANAPK